MSAVSIAMAAGIEDQLFALLFILPP